MFFASLKVKLPNMTDWLNVETEFFNILPTLQRGLILPTKKKTKQESFIDNFLIIEIFQSLRLFFWVYFFGRVPIF